MPSTLDVFLHTNRADAWNEPPAKSSYRAHAGWASEQITIGEPPRRVVINVTAQRDAHECCYRAPWSANACYKYDWMLEAWRRGSQGPQQRDGLQGQQQQQSLTASSLALLSDTDVIFQCDAGELQERFRTRFGGAPLVVGGERKWYPLTTRRMGIQEGCLARRTRNQPAMQSARATLAKSPRWKVRFFA